jgi:hypothetical protein
MSPEQEIERLERMLENEHDPKKRSDIQNVIEAYKQIIKEGII